MTVSGVRHGYDRSPEELGGFVQDSAAGQEETAMLDAGLDE